MSVSNTFYLGDISIHCEGYYANTEKEILRQVKLKKIAKYVQDIIKGNRITKELFTNLMNEVEGEIKRSFVENSCSDDGGSNINGMLFLKQIYNIIVKSLDEKSSLDFLFEFLDESVDHFRANENIPFFVCDGKCYNTIKTDIYELSKSSEKDFLSSADDALITCKCRSDVEVLFGYVGNDINKLEKLHDHEPLNLLLLLSKYISHTNKYHFEVLTKNNHIEEVLGDDEKRKAVFNFNLKKAFINVNIKQETPLNVQKMLLAFCALSPFDTMFRRVKGMSHIMPNILLSFMQIIIYKTLCGEQYLPNLDFDQLLSCLSYINLFGSINNIFRSVEGNKTNIDGKIALIDYIQENYPIQQQQQQQQAQFQKLSLDPDIQNALRRPENEYISFGFTDCSGKKRWVSHQHKLTIRKRKTLTLNAMHQCENIWKELKYYPNMAIKMDGRNIENNFLGLLCGHFLKVLKDDLSLKDMLLEFWNVDYVNMEAINTKLISKETFSLPEIPKEIQSAKLLLLLSLCKINHLFGISHLELLIFEFILASNASINDIEKLENAFLILQISVFEIVKEMVKDPVAFSSLKPFFGSAAKGSSSSDDETGGVDLDTLKNKIMLNIKAIKGIDERNIYKFVKCCRSLSRSDQEYGRCINLMAEVNQCFNKYTSDFTNIKMFV